MQLRELSAHIRRNGFDYYQVAATEFGFVYVQRMPENEGGKILAYEVFERRENDYHGCISFPGNQAFGSWAWSCGRLEDALDRLRGFGTS